jgi:hypothetical protein
VENPILQETEFSGVFRPSPRLDPLEHSHFRFPSALARTTSYCTREIVNTPSGLVVKTPLSRMLRVYFV